MLLLYFSLSKCYQVFVRLSSNTWKTENAGIEAVNNVAAQTQVRLDQYLLTFFATEIGRKERATSLRGFFW